MARAGSLRQLQSGPNRVTYALVSAVCSLATDCAPRPRQSTGASNKVHPDTGPFPTKPPPLLPFSGLLSHQLTLKTAPQLLESCRGTAAMSTWARRLLGSLLPRAMESSGGLVKTQVPGPTRREATFLTSSQVILPLLIQGPHCENY